MFAYRFFSLAAVAPMLLVAACSGAPNSAGDPSDTSEDELKARTCGGIAGLTCPRGYECEMTPPFHPDQAGKCVKPAGGERCGNVVCGAGTVCCNPVMNICTAPGMNCIL